jgi:hypothetical protein
MIGVMAPASRIFLARAFSMANRPDMPVSAASGQRSTAVSTRVMPGDSKAKPAHHSIAAGTDVPSATGPAITSAVTSSSARPPPRHSTANASRTRLSQRRCSADSASASVGRTLVAALAAINAAASAVSRPTPTLLTAGTQLWWYTNAFGTMPLSANRPSSHRPALALGR